MLTSALLSILGFLVVEANAAPSHLLPRQSITTLTTSQVAAFKPFTLFASTAYCQPSTTLTWSCGANCNANAGFIPVASGGDGNAVQFWFVGYSPSQNSVIVSHQGTDLTQVEALETNAIILRRGLNPSLFPSIDSSVQVHDGYANEQEKTATQILSAVRKALSAHGADHVTVVGHSLGGALALLDGIYLPLHIPGATFRTITYGMPYVGNQAFADYVDAHISLTRIINKEDFVPIIPSPFLGFQQPSGEIHIQYSGAWVSCPGQDNTSDECAISDIPNVVAGTPEHYGPYDGVTMGC